MANVRSSRNDEVKYNVQRFQDESEGEDRITVMRETYCGVL